jgi:UDP-glucuronate 4-epimerase
MTVLVAGAAGFIGFHTCAALLARGDRVIGVDELNDYYDVGLKTARRDALAANENFSFARLDIADRQAVAALFEDRPDITRVVNLAAQAGVRHSLVDPYAYTRSNVEGHLVVLEACRTLDRLDHVVYASSSSVYGGNERLPFSTADRVDAPLSLYAATKKSAEMISHAYAHLFRMPLTGLRFFTVYGPWGRPDMAAFIFTRKILAGEPIEVFNKGDMRRDFTYIDDIVAGVVACLDQPPGDSDAASSGDDGTTPPAAVYNIGNNRAEPLMRFISILEETLGAKAEIEFLPMQPGDIRETCADIEATTRDFGFRPTTTIDEGIPRFVRWYRDYYDV